MEQILSRLLSPSKLGQYQQMDATKRAYLELHLAVFLWGFTAILGDLISLSAVVLVWWRVLLTSVSVLFFIRGFSSLRKMGRRAMLQFAFVGALTGLHWLTFFGAVKLSNVSICLVCMATCSFFTAIFEPLILGSKFKPWELLVGLLVVPGMALVVGSVDVSMHAGIWVGLTSAFLASVFSIFNKKWIGNAEPMPITFVEMTSAWLTLSLLLPFFFHAEPEAPFLPNMEDLGMLLVLALVCTTLTWVLALRALRHLSAFASTLTVNLEPVYGIALAWVLLGEHKEMSPGFYWGVGLILVVVFSYPVLNRRLKKGVVEG